MDTPKRSGGGVFSRSFGGVRGTSLLYYYPTPTVDTILNLSDFTSWTNTPHTTGVYTNGAAITNKLYSPTTGLQVGALTNKAVCRPKLNITDLTGGGGLGSLSAPSACPPSGDNAHIEDSAALASRVLYRPGYTNPGFAPTPEGWYYGQNASLISREATYTPFGAGYYNGCFARSSIATLSTTYYVSNISGAKRLARVGNKFYRHRILIVNDETINTWFTGKFTDDLWFSDTTRVDPTRNTATYINSIATWYSVGGGITISYYSCPIYNTRITLDTN